MLSFIILVGPCSQCFSQGIFIVGGKSDATSHTNHTEIIDPVADMPSCNEPARFPSEYGRFAMVGTYLSNASSVFCGGTSNDQHHTNATVFNDCYG